MLARLPVEVEVVLLGNVDSDLPVEEARFEDRYRQWRRSYYNRFPTFWGTIAGASVEEYAVYGALEISSLHAQELRTAATRLYQLLTRLATLIQQSDVQILKEMGIPEGAIPYACLSIPAQPAVMCGRMEFVMTASGPRLLEFNAETPTFVLELFHMNGQVCADFGLPDPNHGCQDQLVAAMDTSIRVALEHLQVGRSGLVCFSANAEMREERGTTEFYRHILGKQGALAYETTFCALEDLRVHEDGLYTVQGERIDVLYKLYPTEYLIEDTAPDGSSVGLALMDLVRQRKLMVLNPPVAFILQNKALLAILWALHEGRSDLFTSDEHMWLEHYMLPTYMVEHDEQGQPLFLDRYVVKPVYGREGCSVTIRQQEQIIEQSEMSLYGGQVMVYQQYAALPTTSIQTEIGLTEVNLVHNCFITGGTASAIGVRAARNLIFDDNSYFLPVCYPLISQKERAEG